MPEKLLILDDEPLILKSLENLFEDDYEVFTATNPETALLLADVHDLAVILCDERMPVITGHEFLQRVREVSGATRVMMSGYADMNALTEAVNSGQIFSYVAKPWEPLHLRTQIAAAVTHFKLTQDVDRERELLRALMENSPDLIYFKDCQSRFTRVNAAHARNLGAADAAECIGKTNADYFKIENALDWQLEEIEIVKSCQPLVDRIQQVRNYRGGLSWWSTTKVPMFDRSGRVSGIAGISRNITSIKDNEELLQLQNEHNRMIIETASDAFIEMEADGAIVFCNPQAARVFGWTADEMKGRLFCETLIPPDCRHLHEGGMAHFLANAGGAVSTQPIELTALHRDGHEFPAEARIWPVRIGEACRFNAFVHDISERRLAEEARSKETSRLALLQSVTVAANQSSHLIDTVRICLDRICAYTGWPAGHAYLRGSNSANDLSWDAIWHDAGNVRLGAFREASDCELVFEGSGFPNCVLTSGKPRWIANLSDEEPLSTRTAAAMQAGLRSGFAFPILVEEKTIGVLEFFSFHPVPPDDDLLTLMVHIGLQLGQVVIRESAKQDLERAKSSAEFANRAKSEFLTTMSHEIRTPMNAILGMADMLSGSSLNVKQRDYVRVFQEAGGHLLDLINNVLDFSKVESGYITLESIDFDLNAVLGRIIEMMSPRARERGLQLLLDVDSKVPLALIGDSNRLQQILVNLVGNALKFTERGSVTLRVEVDSEVEVECLRFTVADTGIGIAADQTAMIFEHFTQADSSTTRKYGGSGLGLAISKGLVELMGGRIYCTSEPGIGSSFFVTLRFGVLKQSAVPDLVEPTPVFIPPVTRQRAAHRVLIAEDSEFNLLVMKAYLEDSVFELDIALNGKIAVDKVKSGNPDLVLMDMQMPVMDGLEATCAIRQWERETHARAVPILALTAHATEEWFARTLEAGCTEHLTKPIQKKVLLDAMARHLSGHIGITPPTGIEHLVPQYLANVRKEMDAILTGLNSKDCEVARRLGHQFKGSGSGYGFPQISRAGAAIELAAIASNEDEVRNHIFALTKYLDRVEVTA